MNDVIAYVKGKNKQIIGWVLPNNVSVECLPIDDPICPAKGKMVFNELYAYVREDEFEWALKYLRSLMAKKFPLVVILK